MPPRYFTREEASAALPAVRELAEQLVGHRRALAEAQLERAELVAQIAGNGGSIDPGEIVKLDERVTKELTGVARCVNGIHQLGAVVKDPDSGLVDFPALRDGEEVLLCWQVGEDEIGYWHGLEEGYAGRKPLD